MVHVTKTQQWDFEIPDTCVKCPMHYSGRGEGFSIEYCMLKKDRDFPYNTVKLREDSRDDNCPAENGQSYAI